MAGFENIIIIFDPRLVEYFFWPKPEPADLRDPMLIETTVTAMTATNPTDFLIRECPYLEVGSFSNNNIEIGSTYFEDAIKTYLNDIYPKRKIQRKSDLIFVLSGSPNQDRDITSAMKSLYDAKAMGIVYVDLGSYLDTAICGNWLYLADYLVRYKSSVLKREHLDTLWKWIPTCRLGFQDYWFEGHHPNEPTWLSQPPEPFGFWNLILARKIEDWGPLREGYSEPVAG
jgi:hypothetical protein